MEDGFVKVSLDCVGVSFVFLLFDSNRVENSSIEIGLCIHMTDGML